MTKILVCGDFRAKEASRVKIDKRLQEIIRSADFAVCNFEAPVGGYFYRKKRPGIAPGSELS